MRALLDAGPEPLRNQLEAALAADPTLGEIGIAVKGPDYSLVNKRYPCRWKPHCTGWLRVYFQSGLIRPLWDDATASRWIEEDEQEHKLRQVLTAVGLQRLGTFRDQFTVGWLISIVC